MLAGVVAENQFGNAGVDGANFHSAIQPCHTQVSVALDLLPIWLKLVLVSKFVE